MPRKQMNPANPRAKHGRAAKAFEFILLLPALFVMLLVAVELALLFAVHYELRQGVLQTTDFITTQPALSAQEMHDTFRRQLWSINPEDVLLNRFEVTADGHTFQRLNTTHHYQLILPLLESVGTVEVSYSHDMPL